MNKLERFGIDHASSGNMVEIWLLAERQLSEWPHMTAKYGLTHLA